LLKKRHLKTFCDVLGGMPDYSKSIIYTIRTRDGVYVGSTTNFINRKYAHKQNIYDTSDYRSRVKLYNTIRNNNYEWDMKPYKQFPCENKTQLLIEEERVRQELNADLNMNSCYGDDPKKNNPDYHKLKRQKYKQKKDEEITKMIEELNHKRQKEILK
jgi:hypothetical protein